MPLTVITVKNAPQALRGDLTKWMQEIATGVYVGNFNTKVREQLWYRVKDSVGHGEATISYSYRNEIGYLFSTINAQRETVDFEGIPLVRVPNGEESDAPAFTLGFSNAAQYRKIKKYSTIRPSNRQKSYAVIDIETDGFNENEHSILEIGALKIENSKIEEFNYLIKYQHILPDRIIAITGITQEILAQEGIPLDIALNEFLQFIGSADLIGYNIDFDIKFLNHALKKEGLPLLKNKKYDLMKYVKSEHMFLNNYKLQTVLATYGIEEQVPHRALLDARLIYELSTKVNKFLQTR